MVRREDERKKQSGEYELGERGEEVRKRKIRKRGGKKGKKEKRIKKVTERERKRIKCSRDDPNRTMCPYLNDIHKKQTPVNNKCERAPRMATEERQYRS